jgi:release factor glutamine methyltransferase
LGYKEFCEKLYPFMDTLQADAEISLLLESVGFSKKDFLLGKKLSSQNIEKISFLIQKRISEKIPIQQLIGYSYFMGEKFIVNEHVLIPRPETEILVQEITKLKGQKILDIGTGSGCIAIMSKKITGISVSACDISKKALKTAQINAQNLCVNVDFIHSDLFSNISEKFDIIVSNPPYIPLSKMSDLEEIVLKEPHAALFAPDEKGIEFYKKIIEQSSSYLNEKGHVAFEAGLGQSKYIIQILEQNGFLNIRTIKDLSGIERIIIAQI